jgi:ABC-type dipeptide/oligopeptide/nickel transport system permease component
LVQYARFVSRAARGDLGYSYRQGLPVGELIVDRLQATCELALAGLAVAVLLGVTLGIVAAARHGSALDTAAMTLALLGTSVPSFWLGLLLIIVFGVQLGWLPVSGSGTLKHLLMPAFVLGGFYAAQISRLTRTSLLEVLAQDFVRTAWAKGLAMRAVLLKHVLRNAMLPVMTVLGMDFGRMLGGAVVVETIFAWPGMGRLAVQAVLGRDFPVVQGVAIMGAAIFMVVNLIIDMLYGWVDPRLRASNRPA